ncbi:MAG: PspC domain-containing protein [Bacteroidota bacterium]
MENKRLYRSVRDSQIAGVCGGIADYFNLDPILVRVVFVILVLAGGGGLLAYLILWVVVPRNPEPWFQQMNSNTATPGAAPSDAPGTGNETHYESRSNSPWNVEANLEMEKRRHGRGPMIGGLVLITLGVLFLLDRLLPNVNFHDFWPVILIVIGLALLGGSFSHLKKNNDEL